MPRIPAPLLLLAGAMFAHGAHADTSTTITTGNVNNDGFDDMVVIDPVAQQVDVLLANDTGDFMLTAQGYPDIGAMSSVTLADVNRDGWLDLIIGDQAKASAGVRVLLNRMDGTFAADKAYSIQPGIHTGALSVAAADLDGDGSPDIVATDGTEGILSVLINKGDGNFHAPAVYRIGGDITAVTAADFDGDGQPDLAVTDTTGDAVLILLNLGGGRLGTPIKLAVDRGPVALATADVDGDGLTDLIAADQDNATAAVLINQGGGKFAAPVYYRTGDRPGRVVAADLDGDGHPDLTVAGFGDGSVYLFRNLGDGGFGAPEILTPDYGSFQSVVMSLSSRPTLVSPNLQAGLVLVTPTGQALAGDTSNSVLRQIGGTHDPQSSNGGALDLLSLGLLAAVFGLRRRR